MNGEVRGWVWGSTPAGCLIRCVVLLFTPIVVALWGLDQYLHRQAATGQPGSSGAPRAAIAVRVDFDQLLTVLALVLLLGAGMALMRRFAPQQVQRRLYRGLQVAGGILALLQPGLLLGAAVTAAICWERPRPLRYLVRGCAAVAAALLLALGAWSWGWPVLLRSGHLPIAQAMLAALVEVFLGSVWLRLYLDLTSTAESEVRMAKRGDRMQARFERAAGADPIHPLVWQRTRRHPAGSIDLGVDRVRGRALQVPLRSLRRHATLVGVIGSGKTVAIGRIIDGVLAQPVPWAVLVVDCKGGELHDTAQELAETHGVPFQEVNPGQPRSLRYDITQLGSPAEIADKLTSAFPSTPDAAIYRDTSYHALVHAVAARMSTNGGTVLLEELEATLDKAMLSKLAGQVRESVPGTASELLAIAERMGNPRHTTSSAISGMASRLGALRAGRFAEILNGGGPALDLITAASEPRVTYISLPALASSADLRMMGRVLLSDLKLLAHHRLHPANRPRPCLIVLDEFSALDDPENVRDLLRQAREPELPCLTASQSLPEPGGCRNELLQAGLQVFLKCLPADADEFAMLAGTVIGRSLVHEVEFFPVRSRKGATGELERFRCHPRWFRLFANPGLCGVRFDRPGELPTVTIAQIYENQPDTTLAGRACCWLTERLGGSRREPDVRSAAGSGETAAKPEPAWQAGTGDEAGGSDSSTSRNGDGPRVALAPEGAE
ncbi:type IV secretion system DNA-binding domain-containing protein [Candidatus Nephthysia bennettiae]|uniref:Type IV secretion system DNA-binding domain-containing protein n=1 Tax=Candidatus Nephthysia bennettiae TaxID=3127016 RepID=A0A934K3H2_9BACT|nr:type IV secretion system DNA-binding domain-containing protein [Candidatus Dormibacteraeota bacterium]MBJ7613579.1 type IV secretion system DNA-binding domain-containing protein [Candidatus Dormibacteraeota bacterium]